MSNIWTPFPEKDVWELQRIFLKSESGYTPLLFVDSILRGIIFGKEREWTIFRGCAGFSKRDLLREVGWHMPQDKNHTFWKNNGHALSYEEICNWIETGCDSAVTLEELLAANPGVLCEAGTLTDFNNVTSTVSLKTTEELDNWIINTECEKGIIYFSEEHLHLSVQDPLYDTSKARIISFRSTMNGTDDSRSYFSGFYRGSCPIVSDCISGAKRLSLNDATEIAIQLERKGAKDLAFHEVAFLAAPKYWVGICAEYTDNFEGPLFDRHLEVYAYVNDSVKLTTTNSPKEAHKFRSQDAAIKCIEQKFEKKLEGTAKKAVLIEV